VKVLYTGDTRLKLISSEMKGGSEIEEEVSLASTVPLKQTPSPILLDDSESIEGEENDSRPDNGEVEEERIAVDRNETRLPRREKIDAWAKRWRESTVCTTSFIPLLILRFFYEFFLLPKVSIHVTVPR
jgi:hypothetical protein